MGAIPGGFSLEIDQFTKDKIIVDQEEIDEFMVEYKTKKNAE